MNERECRRIVYARSEMCCERCGHHALASVHHRRKRSAGGKWDPINCVLVCGHGTVGCHSWIEDNPNAAEAEGFHVRPWQDPAEIKIFYRGSWAYLTEDGKVEYETDPRETDPGELESRDIQRPGETTKVPA